MNIKKIICLYFVFMLISSITVANADNSMASAYQITNNTGSQYDLIDTTDIPLEVFHFPSTLNKYSGPRTYYTMQADLPKQRFTVRYFRHKGYAKDGIRSEQYCEYTWQPRKKAFIALSRQFSYTVLGVPIIVQCDTSGTQITIDSFANISIPYKPAI